MRRKGFKYVAGKRTFTSAAEDVTAPNSSGFAGYGISTFNLAESGKPVAAGGKSGNSAAYNEALFGIAGGGPSKTGPAGCLDSDRGAIRFAGV